MAPLPKKGFKGPFWAAVSDITSQPLTIFIEKKNSDSNTETAKQFLCRTLPECQQNTNIVMDMLDTGPHTADMNIYYKPRLFCNYQTFYP